MKEISPKKIQSPLQKLLTPDERHYQRLIAERAQAVKDKNPELAAQIGENIADLLRRLIEKDELAGKLSRTATPVKKSVIPSISNNSKRIERPIPGDAPDLKSVARRMREVREELARLNKKEG